MKNAVIGFPRVGKLRELKFASEKYFRGEIYQNTLEETSKELRKEHWQWQKQAGIDFISSNDFSYYDGVLDTAVLLNAVPGVYRDLDVSNLDRYFAMARGYQGKAGDVRALAMKKWFNTNYHYIVPEIEDDTKISLNVEKSVAEFEEAKVLGIQTKPVFTGAFTFLKLAKFTGQKTICDFVEDTIASYVQLLERFASLGAEWIQFDEPYLVKDLTKEDIELFEKIYQAILSKKGSVKVLLQTYFGDIRDCYENVTALAFDGIGLDFLEGRKTLQLIDEKGFPKDKVLFAGLVNGKNIWKCDYKKVLISLEEIRNKTGVSEDNLVLSTSCSLLHVPYTLSNETALKEEVSKHFAFALEKLQELKELKELAAKGGICEYEKDPVFVENQKAFSGERLYQDQGVKDRVKALKDSDFVRLPKRSERLKLQEEVFGFPLLPTTTIGSFPQTDAVKKNRASFRKGEIDKVA